jgi:hypothetical protein
MFGGDTEIVHDSEDLGKDRPAARAPGRFKIRLPKKSK